MSLGQKLEEARNRKGISIREASESTKIRGDYLSAFESSNFDLGIPDVYLRGFVKLYSRFLDLDSDAVVADLELELGTNSRKTARKSLGSISNPDSNESQDYSKSIKNNSQKFNRSKDNITKPLIITLISLVIFFIIAGSFIAIFFGDDSPPLQTQTDKEDQEINEISVKETNYNQSLPTEKKVFTLSLNITGPTELLIIDDESDMAPRDFKDLKAGWTQNIPISKSFRCYCSNLENLQFAIDDGNAKKIDGSGPGNFSWSP